jgi:hypothetical protein
LPDETVSGMLEQIVGHQRDLASVAKAIGDTTPEQMAADIGVPFHSRGRTVLQGQGRDLASIGMGRPRSIPHLTSSS